MAAFSVKAPTLVVVGGALDDQCVEIEAHKKTVLGSGSASPLRLELGNVAETHVSLVWDDHGLRLNDLQSEMGSFVNGEPAAPDQLLADGDRVCLGPPGSRQSVKFLVRLPEDMTPRASAGPADDGERELDLGAGEDFVLDAPSPSATVRFDADLVGLGGPAPEPEPLKLDAPRPQAEPEEPEPLVLIDADSGDPVGSSVPAGERETVALPTVDPGAVTETAIPLVQPEPEPEPIRLAPEPPASPPPPSPAARLEHIAPAQDYSDMPSIAPDRVREPISLPPAITAKSKGAKQKRGAAGAVKIAIVVGAAALVGIGGMFGYRMLLKNDPPVVQALLPPKVAPGGTVTIKGSGFSTTPADNSVTFGPRAGTVQTASETQLTVALPELDATGQGQQVPVTVQVGELRSNSLVLEVVLRPQVAALAPDVALPGAEVTASGSALGGQVQVRVGELLAEVLESTPESVRFKVPEQPVVPGKTVPVVVQVGSESSAPAKLMLGQLPLLIDAQPVQGPSGERVTLTGRGFATEPDANVVTFAGQRALVLEAGATRLVAVAPPAPGAERKVNARITVTNSHGVSNPLAFLQPGVSATTYVPRFFAAPGPSGENGTQAMVATELGPLLLLSDAAGAASVGARADALAQALNRLVTRPRSGPAAHFEVRKQPPGSVWLAGDEAALVTATAADAAAYGRRLQVHKLAVFWSALLQDYMTLFVRHERPARAIELTPHGRVLLDLYTAVRRRGAGGVPRNQVLPMKPSLESGLRRLALEPGLEKAGPAQALAAVEGLWSGVMEESGVGSKPIELTLRRAGSSLSGTLGTRTGGVSVRVPLEAASYKEGQLRMVATIGGSKRHFVGRIDGAVLSGSILASAAAKDAVGQFSVRFTK